MSVSNAELLKGLASTAISSMDYLQKFHFDVAKTDSNQAIQPVVKGLEDLSKYEWDPELAATIEEDLENLKTLIDSGKYDKGLKSKFKPGLEAAYESGSRYLDVLSKRNDAIESGKLRISEINDEFSVFEERTEESLDVLDDISSAEAAIIDGMTVTATGQIKNDLQNITNTMGAQQIAIQQDYDPDTPGFQIQRGDIFEPTARYIAEELGFRPTTETQTGPVETLYLPDGGEINSKNFLKAKAALDNYELDLITTGEKDIESKISEEEQSVFLHIRQLGQSADENKKKAFDAITNAYFDFHKDGVRPESLEGLLSDAIIKETNADILYDRLKKYGPLYEIERESLATNMLKIDFAKEHRELTGEIDINTAQGQALSNLIIPGLKDTQDKIKTINNYIQANTITGAYIDKYSGVVEDLSKTPGRASFFKDENRKMMTTLLKSDEGTDNWIYNHVEDELKSMSTITDPHPMLTFLKSKDANTQYSAMNRMVNRYWDGQNRLNEAEVDRLFRSGFTGGSRQEDIAQKELFYSLIRDYSLLNMLSPSIVLDTNNFGDDYRAP